MTAVPRRVARVIAAVAALSCVFCTAGCDELQSRTVADDSPRLSPTDAGTLEDVLRDAVVECRLSLVDAGRVPAAGPPPFDYCSLAPFYEGCPLRVCAEVLARRVEPRCPPRDAGVDTADSRLCEAVVWPFLSGDR